MVIGPRMAKGEQRRSLAHRARTKAGTGPELRAEIEGPTKGRFRRPVSTGILHCFHQCYGACPSTE
jgi:hypothetical protein